MLCRCNYPRKRVVRKACDGSICYAHLRSGKGKRRGTCKINSQFYRRSGTNNGIEGGKNTNQAIENNRCAVCHIHTGVVQVNHAVTIRIAGNGRDIIRGIDLHTRYKSECWRIAPGENISDWRHSRLVVQNIHQHVILIQGVICDKWGRNTICLTDNNLCLIHHSRIGQAGTVRYSGNSGLATVVEVA